MAREKNQLFYWISTEKKRNAEEGFQASQFTDERLEKERKKLAAVVFLLVGHCFVLLFVLEDSLRCFQFCYIEYKI